MVVDKYGLCKPIDEKAISLQEKFDSLNAVSKESLVLSNRKSSKRTLIIAGIAIAILAIILSMYFGIIAPAQREKKYNIAMEDYQNKNYSEAAVLFQHLGDYENSYELWQECTYITGKDFFSNKQYKEALAQFETIQSYNDCYELIEKCNYELGMQAYKQGDNDSAIDYLQKADKDQAGQLLEKLIDEKWHDYYADILCGTKLHCYNGSAHIYFSFTKTQCTKRLCYSDGTCYGTDDYNWTIAAGDETGGYLNLGSDHIAISISFSNGTFSDGWYSTSRLYTD